MKIFDLLGIYRTGQWIQIGSIYEPGQKLTLIKKMNKIHQNPAILNGFHDFVPF